MPKRDHADPDVVATYPPKPKELHDMLVARTEAHPHDQLMNQTSLIAVASKGGSQADSALKRLGNSRFVYCVVFLVNDSPSPQRPFMAGK